MADLISLAEYRAIMGYDPTYTIDNDKISASLSAASQAVRTYTQRSFVVSSIAETRSYQYDGSGFLDIDDCTVVTGLTTDAGVVGISPIALDSTMWTAMPFNGPIYNYIVIAQNLLPPSVAMGFERNLDQIGYVAKPPMVNVTATWGWPAIPDDVKMATAWVINNWLTRPSGDQVTSESIEGWSRSWGGRNGAAVSYAIPERARDLLAGYARFDI
jgi:hypothetical protein